jgi:hypothetical protein
METANFCLFSANENVFDPDKQEIMKKKLLSLKKSQTVDPGLCDGEYCLCLRDKNVMYI